MELLDHCPVCGWKKPDGSKEVCRDYLLTMDLFQVVECENCRLRFTNPRPSKKEIAAYYYSEDYISHTDRKSSLMDKAYQYAKLIMLSRKVKIIGKHSKNREQTLLDFGCGTGDFLLAAEKKGYNAIGYEPGKEAASKAQQKGVRVLCTMEDLRDTITHARPDFITLWHVLEHMHEYPEIIDTLHDFLNKNGVLVIAVPVSTSKDANHYGRYWAAYDVPRHLYHFTPDTLVSSVVKKGFTFEGKQGLPFDSYYIALLSEKHKKQEQTGLNPGKTKLSISGIVKAATIASASNFSALLKRTPWSGEVYVFKKTE